MTLRENDLLTKQKYPDLIVASRSIIFLSIRPRQIINLRVTDKSRLFAITECNNCFIIRSPGFLFNEYLHFAHHFVRVSFKHEQYIIYSQTFSQTQLHDIAHEQTIIFRQLTCRSRARLSANEKEEKFASNDKVSY